MDEHFAFIEDFEKVGTARAKIEGNKLQLEEIHFLDKLEERKFSRLERNENH